VLKVDIKILNEPKEAKAVGEKKDISPYKIVEGGKSYLLGIEHSKKFEGEALDTDYAIVTKISNLSRYNIQDLLKCVKFKGKVVFTKETLQEFKLMDKNFYSNHMNKIIVVENDGLFKDEKSGVEIKFMDSKSEIGTSAISMKVENEGKTSKVFYGETFGEGAVDEAMAKEIKDADVMLLNDNIDKNYKHNYKGAYNKTIHKVFGRFANDLNKVVMPMNINDLYRTILQMHQAFDGFSYKGLDDYNIYLDGENYGEMLGVIKEKLGKRNDLNLNELLSKVSILNDFSVYKSNEESKMIILGNRSDESIDHYKEVFGHDEEAAFVTALYDDINEMGTRHKSCVVENIKYQNTSIISAKEYDKVVRLGTDAKIVIGNGTVLKNVANINYAQPNNDFVKAIEATEKAKERKEKIDIEKNRKYYEKNYEHVNKDKRPTAVSFDEYFTESIDYEADNSDNVKVVQCEEEIGSEVSEQAAVRENAM